jgi:hypothetical protein
VFENLSLTLPKPDLGYGLRNDGTPKGNGYFGALSDSFGNVVTELSIGVELDGTETEIPLIVPTLTYEELSHLLSGGEPSRETVGKAVSHARGRRALGLPVFAEPWETVQPPAPPAPGR